jgi:hypothetical protein
MKLICVVYHNPRQTSEPELVFPSRLNLKKRPCQINWMNASHPDMMVRILPKPMVAISAKYEFESGYLVGRRQTQQDKTNLFISVVWTAHYVTYMDLLLSPSLRDPAKLFYQTDKTRRSIVIAYWSIIILAAPLWWYTTSIERLSLPSRHVHQQAENHLQLPVRICLQTVDEHLSGSVRTSFADNLSLEPQRWRGLAVDVFGKANCGMPFINTSPISCVQMKSLKQRKHPMIIFIL